MVPTDSDSPVDVLIAECAEALRNGRRADCLALVAEHPEHASEIEAFVDDFDRMEQRFAPLRHVAGGTPGCAAEVATLGLDDTAVPPPKAGSSFGDYDLLTEVARGGMGVVYKARQKSLNRVVALKMVLRDQRDSSTDRDRFLAEARAVARLNHPNIVPIYEVGEQSGQSFFTMEFFGGGSLRDQCDTLRSDQPAIARMMITIARAVEHAHRRGILHRDIKPNNVLLDERGEPHVTDFGLAKRLDEESDLTLAGAVVGTPSYMAPEQANAQTDLTTAVDVYGLGALMYELLTGRPPFRGNTPLETILAVVSHEPQRPRKLAAAIDADLETICLKCLEKNPLARYSSADTLAEDLERWLDRKPIRARPVSAAERLVKWSRRQPVLAGLLATVAMAAMGLLVLAGVLWQNAELRAQAVKDLEDAKTQLAQVDQERNQTETKKRRAEQLAEEQRQIADQQRTLADRIAAEVKQLEAAASAAKQDLEAARRELRTSKHAADMLSVQNAWSRGDPALTVKLLDQLRPSPHQEDLRGFEWHYFWRLTHDQTKSFPLFPPSTFCRVAATAASADGHRLAAGGIDGTIKVWDIEQDGELHTIAGPWGIKALSFSADGNHLTAIAERRSDELPKQHAENRDRGPLSLDLFQELYQTHTWTLGDSRQPQVAPLQLKNLDTAINRGSDWWVLDKRRLCVDTIVRSPDGSWLALGGRVFTGEAILGMGTRKGFVILWDVGADGVKRQWEFDGSVSSLDFSPDGSTLAIAGYCTLELWDVKTEERRLVFDDQQSEISYARFSRDGNLLATGAMNGRIGLWDTKTGRQGRVFMGHQAAVTSLCFLPDAVVSGSEAGAVNLWRLDRPKCPLQLDGTGMGLEISSLAFSEDGQELTALSRTGAVRSWDTLTGELRSDVKGSDSMWSSVVALSADRRMIATARVEGVIAGGRPYIHLSTTTIEPSPQPSRTLAKLPELYWLAFSPDGRKLYGRTARNALHIWDVISGDLIDQHEPSVQHPAVDMRLSPDGQTIACTWSGELLLWNPATGERRPLGGPGGPGPITAAIFSSDGRFLATTSQRELAVWVVSDGRQIIKEQLPIRESFEQLAFSPDGKRLAHTAVMTRGGRDTSLWIWDVSSGKVVMNDMPCSGVVSAMAFSRDGRQLALASVASPFQPSSHQPSVTVINTIPVESGDESLPR